MPLLDFWKNAKETVLGMTIAQIVGNAGDGNLKDDSVASKELRTFLSEVESENLAEYATYCIENSFNNSGRVLQDVVNEIGRRLGFKVENGRYQGVANAIGFDGIWKASGFTIVIEVKTTDVYTLNLETIVKYRDALAETRRVERDAPILIVLGRQDTEALEAQVRGSKYAWSMRIAGIEALIKLMSINVTATSEQVTQKIHNILRPIEYTRIDRIVDAIFTATEDKEEELQEEKLQELVEFDPRYQNSEFVSKIRDIRLSDIPLSQEKTPQSRLELIRKQIIAAFSKLKETTLVRRKQSLFSDADGSTGVAIAVSKRYDRAQQNYWYAYHSAQSEFLKHFPNGFMIFGCVDKDFAFAIPYGQMEEYRQEMYATGINIRQYWHVLMREEDGRFFLKLPEAGSEEDLSRFRFSVS